MATLGELKAAIADDIDDMTGEYSAQIDKAVATSIRYCERGAYYFNETRDVTFETVANQSIYGAAAAPQIATLIHIQGVYLTRDGGDVVDIWPARVEEIEILSDGLTTPNEPVAWSYFDKALRLYPMPNKAYVIRLQLGAYRLAPITNDDASNVWTEDAYDMVKARAKYVLCKDTLRDANAAAEALSDYTDQQLALKAETNARARTGFIRPTQF